MVKPEEPLSDTSFRSISLEIEISPEGQQFEEFVAVLDSEHENQKARQVYEWELLRKRTFQKTA